MDTLVEEKTHIVNGIRHPKSTTTEHLKDLETFEILEDDVVLITSPKSGTTWMHEVISILKSGCDLQKVDKEYLHKRAIFLDFPFCADKFSSPRLIKTHLPPQHVPQQLLSLKAKILFVSRNPKDVAVSFFHFHNSIDVLPTYNSWSDFLNDFCTGNLSRGDWFDMNTYWWSRRNEKNVLFIKYEDMKKNLGDVVKKVASFLGWYIPEGKLPEIVRHCSFDVMKSNKMVNHSATPGFHKEKSPFMRKGKVGDWKNHFTVAQSEAFDKLYEERMAGTGLEYDYEI